MDLFLRNSSSKSSSEDRFARRADRIDRWAKRTISMGGYGIILIIFLIFLFLVIESLPLSFGARLKQDFSALVGQQHKGLILVGTDEYKEIIFALNEKGTLSFFRTLPTSEKEEPLEFVSREQLPLSPGEKLVAAAKGNFAGNAFAAASSNGTIYTAEIGFRSEYVGDKRTVSPHLEIGDSFLADSSGIRAIAYRILEDGGAIWAWISDDNQLGLRKVNSFGFEEYSGNIESEKPQNPLVRLVIDSYGERLYCGDSRGFIHPFDVTDGESIEKKDSWKASAQAITALSFLIGGEALIIGDASGMVSRWFQVKDELGVRKFRMIQRFDSHDAPVVEIVPSGRKRNFISIDTRGKLFLHYATTGRTQGKLSFEGKLLRTATFSPKSDAILIADQDNYLHFYALNNPHPEVTMKTLFGKVWYESYPQPEFVWQSTGGTDEFEPKFSLVPLIFGTFKGTFYAMLFSVPLALLAAIYVSQFAPRRLAAVVKPTVEIMAALPSVVIGFLAGLYFSPLFERNLMAVFLFMFMMPVSFLVGAVTLGFIPEKKRLRLPPGWEIFYILPFLLVGFWATILLATPVENILFGGDIRHWLSAYLGLDYDTRNSMVVGFALGFAVIPIIFTVAEDSLSNVPSSLTTASLALGASRWQTVRKIVIPAASGGIFAGIMLGLGRAIGETMIVLMATGNTPVLDFSPFNGFRAMSACIAVEIPEAPVGGTLYRVLFLTALLLFLFTFVINTLAAVIGDKLRRKYARF